MIAAAGVCVLAAGAETGFVYLGVLEPDLSVRVAFQFQNGRWEPMPRTNEHLAPLEGVGDACDSQEAKGCRFPDMGLHYPKEVAWTVAFDGKMIGSVRSSQPPVYTYRTQLGMHLLSPDAKPPRIRQGAADFQMGSDFRPLTVISRPNYGDPDRWKPFQPSDPKLSKQAQSVYRALRRPPGSECQCDDEYQVVQPKGYRSARGEMLLAVATRQRSFRSHSSSSPAPHPICPCEGSDWEPDWFLVSNGKFRHIGNNLALIDAGDYDGDGVSEIVFLEIGKGDSEGAYVLFCPRDGSVHEFRLPNPNSY